MAISVVMPALEMAQETGKLVSWLKKEGQSVSKGEPLLEIETDKAVMEIEATGDGVLAGIKAKEGDVIPVGQTIAWILAAGESVPAEDAAANASARATTESARPSSAPISHAAPAETKSASARISPKARRLAQEQGVDISKLQGTGPGGEILAADVQAAASSASTAPKTQIESLTSIGRLMAERTTESWKSVPHFFVTREIDATALVAAKEKFAASAGAAKVTHTDVLISRVAHVLSQHPRINASWTGQGIQVHSEIHIALAMAVNDGVVAAVIPKANTLTVPEIAALRKELTDRARSGKLRPSDIANGTFTISNLGMYNVDAFTAIITPPQAAILAVGRIVDRVVAVDGQPAVRPILTVTLSSDHRVIDGARAAAFLDELARGHFEK
jgi:pyruvate dehydrogenase E2 component (dihydrolipoamide acetyltransferase)